jgi:hypothetical protein
MSPFDTNDDIVLLTLGFSIIVGILAKSRGRSGWGWFFLSCFISPIFAGPLVLALPQPGKACPQCAEQVRSAAVVCRFCGHRFV